MPQDLSSICSARHASKQIVFSMNAVCQRNKYLYGQQIFVLGLGVCARNLFDCKRSYDSGFIPTKGNVVFQNKKLCNDY